jgi:hypothetical protein
MTKKSRPTKHYPGDLERLTVLIESRAKDIARLLLRDVPDAEQKAEDKKPVGRMPKRRPGNTRPSTRKPDKKREIKRTQAISMWRHKAFRH